MINWNEIYDRARIAQEHKESQRRQAGELERKQREIESQNEADSYASIVQGIFQSLDVESRLKSIRDIWGEGQLISWDHRNPPNLSIYTDEGYGMGLITPRHYLESNVEELSESVDPDSGFSKSVVSYGRGSLIRTRNSSVAVVLNDNYLNVEFDEGEVFASRGVRTIQQFWPEIDQLGLDCLEKWNHKGIYLGTCQMLQAHLDLCLAVYVRSVEKPKQIESRVQEVITDLRKRRRIVDESGKR